MKTIQLKPENRHTSKLCNCSAVPQMREAGLRAIACLCEQACDKADAVLLGSYQP